MKRATRITSSIAVSMATLGFSSGAFAAFTGLQSEFAGIVDGRSIFRVYAVASEADDVILNMFDHRITAGSTVGVLHTDSYQDNQGGAPGHWAASYTSLANASRDSFVTITGRVGSTASTTLDPSFGTGVGSDIPFNAGWYTADPGTPLVAGVVGTASGNSWRILIMQVAGNAINYDAIVSIGWKQNVGTTMASFTLNQSYGIPAPGALALLATFGMAGRRRRLGE